MISRILFIIESTSRPLIFDLVYLVLSISYITYFLSEGYLYETITIIHIVILARVIPARQSENEIKSPMKTRDVAVIISVMMKKLSLIVIRGAFSPLLFHRIVKINSRENRDTMLIILDKGYKR
jgi:hypothetical protein